MNTYKIAPVLLLSIFTVMMACKKDHNLQNNVPAPEVESQKAGIQTLSKWGVVITASASEPGESENSERLNTLQPVDKCALAEKYGVTYIRSGITKKQWDDDKDGFLFTYDQYTDKGFRIALNIIWKDPKEAGVPTPVPFVTNADNKNGAYYKFVNDVITTLASPEHKKPALVVVENEETNKKFYILDDGVSDYDKYIEMLSTVVSICKKHDINVTNGGITCRGLTFATHDWLYTNPKRKQEANDYAYNSMPLSAYHTLYPPCPTGVSPIGKENISSQCDMINYYVDHYKLLDISGINIHWYEPVKIRYWDDSKNNGTPWKYGVDRKTISQSSLITTIEYLTKIGSPKKVLSNEIGQLTTTDCLTKDIMNLIDTRPYQAFSIALWYDGDGGEIYGAKALHNTFIQSPLYTFRRTGLMFEEIVSNPASSKSCTP